MLDNEKSIRESEQLRILKNYIYSARKSGKAITFFDLENLIAAMDLKEVEEKENA